MVGSIETSVVRLASVADAEIIARQRTRLYSEIGKLNSEDEEIFASHSQIMLAKLIESNEYVGWFVEVGEKILAGGGVIVRDLLPNSSNPTGCKEAYILNIYTNPEERRSGFARLLMNTILKWCRENGIERITLHTSDVAKSLYSDLGFVSTAEMRFDGNLHTDSSMIGNAVKTE